jgi:hypothetical protein
MHTIVLTKQNVSVAVRMHTQTSTQETLQATKLWRVEVLKEKGLVLDLLLSPAAEEMRVHPAHMVLESDPAQKQVTVILQPSRLSFASRKSLRQRIGRLMRGWHFAHVRS